MIDISFIMPCYNVENYVEECIISIEKLLIPVEKFELIMVNDGSTDETLSILRKYKEKHNYKLLNFEKPSGYAGRPRNKGLEIARGNMVIFIDPDDKFLGTDLYDIYKRYNEHYDVIISSFILENPDGVETDRIILKNTKVNFSKDLWPQIKNVCNQRTMFNRKFLLDNNIKFYEDCRSQDLLFLYQVYVLKPEIRLTDKIILKYLDERPDSVSNMINNNYIDSSLLAFERLYSIIENKLTNKEITNIMSEHFIGYYLNVRKKINKEQKEKILKVIRW